MIQRISNPRRAAAALFSFALLAAAPSARATDVAPYRDRDSNVLKVGYYFVYPVGKLAELLIFRPLHTISALSQPDPDAIRAGDDDASMHCLSFRPNRACSHKE